MGDPSYLRFVPASIANIPIDWTRVPEASKKRLLEGWSYDWENEVDRPLPTTVAELAKMFDDSKFFGYFRADLCILLMDISEFGLQPAPNQVGPRFYMKYLDQVWFLLFTPGKRDCVSGFSHDIIRKAEEEGEEGEEALEAAEDLALAQEFDVRLERDVLGGKAGLVDITKKLGGWEASTLQEDLQSAQYFEAMMTLPDSHPAKRGVFANLLSRFFRPMSAT